MAARKPPTKPLLVILGSTGTGKSELAVELATRYRGEIVNADAMQLYKGLPIITNKITEPEQRGIPHHLLDHIDLDQQPWVVGDFRREAARVIDGIRARGNLPIVVGGTQYYIDGLLFDDVLLGPPNGTSPGEASAHAILSESTDVILERLREVDPSMADRWHPSDRRKIQRSLQIWLDTGRRASEIYAEQKARRAIQTPTSVAESDGLLNEGTTSLAEWPALLFWLHTEPEVLKERVSRRIEKMLDKGLVDETTELYQYLAAQRTAGHEVDPSKGIFQSIGYRQFEPYLRAREDPSTPEDVLARLLAASVEQMQGATRRYAKSQTRWIATKLVPRLRDAHPAALAALFVVDSTNMTRWADDVVAPAAEVTRAFLDGVDDDHLLPDPASLSDAARAVLADAGLRADAPPAFGRRTCDDCGVVCVTEETWLKHVRSRRHSKTRKKGRRKALVPYEDRQGAVDVPRADGSDSSLSSLGIDFSS